MAAIYDYENGTEVCSGLQGSDVCNEATRAAVASARELNRTLVLDDDDGLWLVEPDGLCREMLESEIQDGGWGADDE